MVYITLGTQGADFSRCLKAVEELIENEHLKDEFIAQVGKTSYKPKNIKCFDYVNENDYQKYISKADVIITHAGSGALFNCIKKGKKVIAIARLAKYGEMVNDHQTEIVRKLADEGYILDGTYDLKAAWKNVSTFEPRKNDFHCEIGRRIEQLLADWGVQKRKNEN